MCVCCYGPPVYACFECRYVRKIMGRFSKLIKSPMQKPKCGSCGTELIHIGKGDFATPSKHDNRGWANLRKKLQAQDREKVMREIRKTIDSSVAQR